jgi:hypothetical protein
MSPIYDLSELDLESAVEPTVVDEGEYNLRIIDVTEGTDKNSMAYIMPRLEVVDNPYSKDFTIFLHIPDKATMDAKRLNTAKVRMTNFLKCFGVDPASRINFKDNLPGKTGWCLLGVGEDDPQFGKQNYVKKNGFLQPR